MRVSQFSVRIIGITLLAVFLTAVSVNTLSLNEHRNLYVQKSMQNLDALSENLSESLLPFLVSEDDIPNIATTLLQLDRHDSTVFARVFDKNDQQVFFYVNPAKQTEWSDTTLQDAQFNTGFGTELVNKLLVSNKMIGDESYAVGRLLIVQDPESSLKQSANTYLKKVIPLLVFIASLVGFLAFSMQKRVLQKLNLVTSFVRKIKHSGNKLERLTIENKDEIGLLAEQINEYLDTIKNYEFKIQKQLNDLEENKQNLEKIANYDSLTGLPNRQMLHAILRSALAREQRRNADLAILYFDLDNFKHVNDTLGHDVGDQLLFQVGERVSHLIREGDMLARLGGDEFIVLLINNEQDYYPPSEVAMITAQRIADNLKKIFYISKWEVSTAASIGIAYAKQANFDTELLLRNADIAMYQAKLQRTGGFALFENAMHTRVQRRHEIASSILRAIQTKELYLAYQPKLNQQAEITGFEALLRWEHPTLGALSPVEFIEIAEKTGKITALTSFVLDNVISDLFILKAHFHSQVSVAVNLSAMDLKSDTFKQQTLALLVRHANHAPNLEFEITESAYLDNFDAVNEFVINLHLAGCKVSLDDFGTGYSSLSYLTKLDIDLLKIDRSFIHNMENGKADKNIVETIISLANNLTMSVCAEGVEQLAQFDYLKKIGCDYFQGYYFCRPVPLKTLLETYPKTGTS
ncbi:EAL domain-containing protein [Rheinheimera sp. UJ51]|uniref:EAL domain-containing protein n=1 Tax=Rheinheimera sp. UJ51 TaxID=2892446 RepID=UPI001E47143D|nr:EAL domain-containing protein [Rheinheimera sp. UJ51]MCC5452396.1 EAL domain-containing protein [Rheinheimera sp. UJ51]